MLVVFLCLDLVFLTSVWANYAPVSGTCPPFGAANLRYAGTPQKGNQVLNPAESNYVANRRAITNPAVQNFIGKFGQGVVYEGDIRSVPQNLLPTIGLSFSGGGNRTALYAAGVLAALDGRNASSNRIGTGGLLQSASYISGLSGGSWFLTSLVFNNLPDSYIMVLGDNKDRTNWPGWLLTYDFENPTKNSDFAVFEYESLILQTVNDKWNANYQVTVNDFWSRALSYHYLPGTNQANFFDNDESGHGASITLSSATRLPAWRSNALPFPLIVSDVYSVNVSAPCFPGGIVPLQNVVYESSPLEYGSYDPMLGYFIPMQYLGTTMNQGSPVGNCTTNYDNAGFVFGTSSNIWHGLNVTNAPQWNSQMVQEFFEYLQFTYDKIGQALDVSDIPNPFYDVVDPTYQDRLQTELRGIDGGSDAENEPLAPLLVKSRNIDFIFAADASADTQFNKPNGNSITATVARSKILPAGTVNLPPMPTSTGTFVNQRLNTRPTFFGCAGTPELFNGVKVGSPYPMVVYLPNDDSSSKTNTTTVQWIYTDNQASNFLDNSFNITTRGFSGTPAPDPEWSICLACAVVERTRGRMGVNRTKPCSACFARYCWSGVGDFQHYESPIPEFQPWSPSSQGMFTVEEELEIQKRIRKVEAKIAFLKAEERRLQRHLERSGAHYQPYFQPPAAMY